MKYLLLAFLLLIAYHVSLITIHAAESDLAACTLTLNPEPVFLEEDFKINASTNMDHIFKGDSAPYVARISYGIDKATGLPLEEVLGNLRLSHDPDDETPICECREYDNEERKCVKWVEKDTCDQEDSRYLVGGDRINKDEVRCGGANDTASPRRACKEEQAERTFRFDKYIGPAIVKIYEKDRDGQKGKLVCVKNTRVEPTRQITIDILEPVNLGDKIVIQGKVLDHLQPVKGIKVTITINDIIVDTNTDEVGSYIYNLKDTTEWRLSSSQVYDAKATTTINGKGVIGLDKFGVGITPTDPSQNPGVSPRVILNRYYHSFISDYWSTTSLQTSGALSSYHLEGSQGEPFSQNEGGGLVPLYDCLKDEDHYNTTSLEACQKDGTATLIGFIYPGFSAGAHPLYVCKKDGDHKTSLREDCRDDPEVPTDYKLDTEIAPNGLLGYAPDNQGCQSPGQNQAVTAQRLNQDSSLTKRLLQGLSPKEEVLGDLEKNPLNAQNPCTGISEEKIDAFKIILDINLKRLFCAIGSLFGVTGSFCTQDVEVGDGGTNKLLNFSQATYNISGPNNLQLSPHSPDPKSIQDVKPEHKGSKTVSDLTSRLEEHYSATTFVPDDLKQIVENYYQNSELEYGENFKEHRVGFTDATRCLMLQAIAPRVESSGGKIEQILPPPDPITINCPYDQYLKP